MLLVGGRALIAVLVVGVLVVGCGGGGSAGMPRLDGKTSHADGSVTWYVNFQWHGSVKSVSGPSLDYALDNATFRWFNDDDGSDPDLGADDVKTCVTFTRSGSPISFGPDWLGPEWADIAEEEVDTLSASGPPQMGAWVLIVKTLPGGYARAVVGSPRILVQASDVYDGGILAHEFGHNSGLSDRSFAKDGKCSIMKSEPDAGESRLLVSPAERDKMMELILP